MAAKLLDSNSKFNIYSSFTLSNDDVAAVSLLYGPLIGSDAAILYFAFSSLLERNNLKSEEIIHQDFFDLYSLKPQEFIKARHKLEGIGLLVTYLDNNNYIYLLCPPLSPKTFIKDVTLGLYLYSKLRKETFDFIYEHFKIEKLDKNKYENITKSFDEVYESRLDNDTTFDKFQYILGKKPNKGIVINDYKFDFDYFVKEINTEFLEVGVTKTFKKQICDISFVYGFNEAEMISIFNDSINKSGYYDFRLLKKKANILFTYKKNMNAPKLEEKNEETINNNDIISFLDNASPSELLAQIVPDFPAGYLDNVMEIYSAIELPRGVLNCMIMKVLKDKSGELPSVNYFKKVAESWIMDNIFSTSDAIVYVTTPKDKKKTGNLNSSDDPNGGLEEL